MRSREFIKEANKKGKMSHTASMATPGAIRIDGFYGLYRSAIAMAGMDHNGNMEHEIDSESWIGRDGYVGTYTEEERQLAKKAFAKIGMTSTDFETGPSLEPPAVNTQSPVIGFKGYPR
jgi:hypothetical protein|tara:strand:+ start:740 stop:1096 length:357 start_codon:yes stop_codon:yes gene_type:complete